MAKKYSVRQLQEAVSYWRGILKGGSAAWKKAGRTRLQICEALDKWENELNERELDEGKLEDFIKDNGLTKETAFSDENVAKLKKILKVNPDKAKASLQKYFEKNGGKDEGGKGADPKAAKAVEKAVEAAAEKTDPKSVGLKSSEEDAENGASAKPIGSMNLMNRLHRLHNATEQNVIEKLSNLLPWNTADKIEVLNSCDQDDGTFAIPDDGNMFITVKVSVDDVDRKGFKKFIGGMFGKAMNEEEPEQVDEGALDVIGKAFAGIWKGTKEGAKALADGTKEGAQKAAEAFRENVAKVNEEMKKRVGVAAIQEYVMRFCGKAMAKKVNYQNIQVALENEGTESETYVFTGCIKIVK